jgi:hypothetical protein
VHLCDADAALLLLTLAPPLNEPSDTYLLSGTVTGSTPCELTRTLFSLVEEATSSSGKHEPSNRAAAGARTT